MLLAEGSHIAVDDLRLGDIGTSGRRARARRS